VKISNEMRDSIISKYTDKCFDKIIYADFTEDTYDVIKVSEQEWKSISAEGATEKLSDWLGWFSRSYLCFEGDKARFQEVTDVEAISRAIRDGQNNLQLIYRRKFDISDEVYNTVMMEIFPLDSDDGHSVGLILVRNISDEFQTWTKFYNSIEGEKDRSGYKRTVLIVEDNELNMDLLTEILSDKYEILQAQNGKVGLEVLQNHMEAVSVIILDIQMPVMNGYEFLEVIKEDPFLSNIPVIITSGNGNEEEELKCLKLGCADFVSKPYNNDIIKNRIASVIKLRESASALSVMEYDELTGVYTRQAFFYHAERTIRNNPGKEYIIFATDIREFKLINTVYGEKIGDSLLKEFANSILSFTEGSSRVLGRYGSDRFVCLCEKGVLPDDDDEIKDLIQQKVDELPIKNLIVKLGICSDIKGDTTVALASKRAITILDMVKESYETRVVRYNGTIASRKKLDYELESNFFRALNDKNFEAWYQPKINPVTGHIFGAEALVRWRRDNGEYYSPGTFIPLFERNGLITRLDEYMFREVCLFQSERLKQGKRTVPISVNLSRKTLFRNDIVEIYKSIAEELEVPLMLVPLEITESAAMLSTQIAEIIEEFAQAGFALHMDDFGSEYSSISSLSKMHFEVIKVDKSLTDAIGTPNGNLIISYLLELIHKLGMKSVVEGVETEEQVRFLKKCHCDSVQGYYYHRPMPEDDFNEVLLEAFGESSEQGADHKITVKDCYESFNGNYEEAKQRLMDDKRIERFMLKFLSDDTMDQIKAAITRGNYEELHRAVHTLKGLAASLSFTELQYAAEDFADQLDRTKGTVDQDLFEHLEVCYARVVETIEEYKAQKLLNQ
jgi:diguanylate cyclase (GGDEF)-like protein